VLDVGTGSGIFAEEFDQRGLHVSGVNANPEVVELAGGFVPQADFKEGIAEHQLYPDRSFDLFREKEENNVTGKVNRAKNQRSTGTEMGVPNQRASDRPQLPDIPQYSQ